jgi:ABC-type lipoprotein release transport system permease subunit
VTAALGLGRVVASLLYGIEPTDVVSFALPAVGLFGLCLMVCSGPARRAARVDPAAVLRAE